VQETVIRMDSVSKKFCRQLKKGIVYTAGDVARDLLGIRHKTAGLRPGEFWSVKDVSFELNRGECLAIIGANGAGKSTILKMLNGIYMPDCGRIEVNGRVGALIEVGAGFHPMLTGRENIYINGAILGMSREEIDSKFDTIVEFSGLDTSMLDAPVKTYSSGMYVRLGFSVAIHTDPDILLVDEVLSVGDIRFVGKCRRKIAELRERGVSIILVSHSLTLVEETCDRGLFVANGQIQFAGSARGAVQAYREAASTSSARALSAPGDDSSVLRFVSAELLSEHQQSITSIVSGELFYLDLMVSANTEVDYGRFAVWIVNTDNDQIAGVGYQIVGKDLPAFGSGTIRFAIRCQLIPGDYRIGITYTLNDVHRLVDEFQPCALTVLPAPDTYELTVGVYMLDIRTVDHRSKINDSRVSSGGDAGTP
jgi:lipopolysaccharide transport system ATP-binding protein